MSGRNNFDGLNRDCKASDFQSFNCTRSQAMVDVLASYLEFDHHHPCRGRGKRSKSAEHRECLSPERGEYNVANDLRRLGFSECFRPESSLSRSTYPADPCRSLAG